MQVQSINNVNNNPNFGAFKTKNTIEVNYALKILMKNCPGYYNNLMNNCKTLLQDTKYFDGLLDIEYGQLVMRLVHSKNFEWPSKKSDIVNFSDKHYSPRLILFDDMIEFSPDNDEELRLKKLNENDRKVTYTVKNWVGGSRLWVDKASVEQAKLIKKLDDCIRQASGDVVYIDGKPIAYNPNDSK